MLELICILSDPWGENFTFVRCVTHFEEDWERLDTAVPFFQQVNALCHAQTFQDGGKNMQSNSL